MRAASRMQMVVSRARFITTHLIDAVRAVKPNSDKKGNDPIGTRILYLFFA